MLRLQAAITIISDDRVLVGAAAVFQSGPLSNVRNLVARVVGVQRRRINAAVFPVENFSLDLTAQYVVIDVLLTFLLNPGTALYVGYNTRYQQNAVESLATAPVRTPSLFSTPVGRQLFAKVSYLFRF